MYLPLLFIDTAPVESGTHYHAFYVMGDDEVGQVSADVVVSV